MNPFTFYTPTKYQFGPGVVDAVGETLAGMGWQRVLLVYGKGSAVRSGLIARVKASLAQAGVEVAELAGVRPNPEIASVREGVGIAREFGVQGVLAVGGGSVIDASKAVAMATPYDGDAWDFFCGKATAGECLPIAVVLTIPAAGSEGSSSCVISNDELGAKNGTNGDSFRPKLAFLDPELTYTLPPYQTAAGVTDMIAHVCERSFSGVGAVRITDYIAYGLVRTLIEMAPRALANPSDYEARANIMWAGTLAHNDIAGCGRGKVAGRVGGWESHALEHAMSAHDTTITHGAGLAVILPAWMRYVWREDPQRFLDFGRGVFGIEPASDSEADVEQAVITTIDALSGFFTSIGMPSKLGEFGLARGVIPTLASSVIAVKGEPFGCFKPLVRADIEAIYESAF